MNIRQTSIAACVAATIPVSAHAKAWPEHGYYRVEDGIHSGERYCRLKGEVDVNGKPFALVLTEQSSGKMLAQVLALDVHIVKAKEVWVGFDQKGVLHFTVGLRDPSPELESVTGEVPDGAATISRLRKAAKGAKWLMVSAPPYSQVVPANGAEEALGDLEECGAVRT